jgi:hypothetical protein
LDGDRNVVSGGQSTDDAFRNLGIAAREGHPISFWEFTRKGAIVTALSIAISVPYLWLRYFALG